MNIKYKMMFLQGDAGGGEGGGGSEGPAASEGDVGISHGAEAFAPATKTQVSERPLPESKKPTEAPPGAGTDGAGTAPAAPFDPKAFAHEFGDVIGQHLKPLAEKIDAGREPEVTPEEARRILNIWEPDDAWYKAYDNLETRGSAVQQMRDGLIRQADTIAQLRMQEAVTKLREELMPHLQGVEEMASAQREARFNGSFPQLAEPKLRPLITAVTQGLVNEGKKFNSEGEMFKAIADGVEAVIKVNNPDFKLTAGSTPASSGRNSNALPVTTPGSGGAAGRSGTSPEGKLSRGLAIFDKK